MGDGMTRHQPTLPLSTLVDVSFSVSNLKKRFFDDRMILWNFPSLHIPLLYWCCSSAFSRLCACLIATIMRVFVVRQSLITVYQTRPTFQWRRHGLPAEDENVPVRLDFIGDPRCCFGVQRPAGSWHLNVQIRLHFVENFAKLLRVIRVTWILLHRSDWLSSGPKFPVHLSNFTCGSIYNISYNMRILLEILIIWPKAHHLPLSVPFGGCIVHPRVCTLQQYDDIHVAVFIVAPVTMTLDLRAVFLK